MRSTPRDALIASSVSAESRGRAFGLEGVGDNASAFLGPLLAVFLLYALHVGIRTIFYLAAIPSLLAFAMVLFVKEQRATAVQCCGFGHRGVVHADPVGRAARVSGGAGGIRTAARARVSAIKLVNASAGG